MQAMPLPSNSPQMLGGIACLVLSMALLTSHDAAAKFLVVSVAPVTILWCRYLFQVAATAGAIVASGDRSRFRTACLGLELVRGALVITSTLMAFLALGRLPLAEFTAICCLTPVAVTLLARVVLREDVTAMQWVLVVVGLCGALLVARPGGSLDLLGMAFAVLVVLGYASFQTLTGVIARRDGPLTINWYTSLTGAVGTSMLMPWVWVAAPTAAQWVWLGLAATLGTLGQFLMVVAFSRAPASVLAPYLYTAMLFSLLAGWWVFAQAPDAWAFAGMALIAVSGVAGAVLRARVAKAPAVVSAAQV